MLASIFQKVNRSPVPGVVVLQLVRRFGSFRHGLATATSPGSDENPTIKVDIHHFKGHKLEPPEAKVETSRDELLRMFKLMLIMRRTEVLPGNITLQKD
jgi:hypothetical protein